MIEKRKEQQKPESDDWLSQFGFDENDEDWEEIPVDPKLAEKIARISKQWREDAGITE